MEMWSHVRAKTGDILVRMQIKEEIQMEDIIEKLKTIVNSNYNSQSCAYTEERSDGNSSDVFEDGYACGESWLAYKIGCILGMELEEPEQPEYDD